jgi:hypothetical protein
MTDKQREVAESIFQRSQRREANQPTPGTVENAERKANAEGDAALERARKADVNGDADACAEALREARHLYGLD